MRKNARLALAGALAVAGVAQVPAAERHEARSAGAAMMTLDFQASFKAFFPGPDADGIRGLLLGDDDPQVLHRVLMDKERGLYYAYDVVIAKADGGFDVRVQPLRPEAERYFVEARWKELCATCAPPQRVQAAQRFPAPRRIRTGDTIGVDLLEDGRGGVVTDEITVQAGVVPNAPPGPLTTSKPVDFDAEAVWLQVASARLMADGHPAWPLAQQGGSVQGEIVWVDLPRHGRVFFSLAPRPKCGLKRIGVVAGDTLTFTLDGIKYEWKSAGPIATPGPVAPFTNRQGWNVWGVHDKDWQPFPAGQYTMGGMGDCPEAARVSSR
jgi:hypothetical protein